MIYLMEITTIGRPYVTTSCNMHHQSIIISKKRPQVHFYLTDIILLNEHLVMYIEGIPQVKLTK